MKEGTVAAPQAERRMLLLGALAIAAVVLAAYYAILKVGFVGDDWIFYELAGRLNLGDYILKYFDPRVQTAWYRPVQGVLFRIGYTAFGANTTGYHLVNVLFHLANALLLLVLVARVTRRPALGLVAALLFATFPIGVQAVFWPGVIDPVTALLYLSAIWFWLDYLKGARPRNYALAFAAFLLGLLTKEIAVTLPVTLFLIDRLVVSRPADLTQLVRRYAPFALVWVVYAPVEWIVTRRSVFVSHEGYQPSLRLFSNLVDYLAGLAFPWSATPLLGYTALALALALLAYAILVKRRVALLPIVVGAVLVVLPVVLFPQVAYRFLYVALAGSATLYALALGWLWRRLPPRAWARALVVAAVGLAVGWGGVSISNAAADFGEFSRVSRVPFRNISQAHPTFPDDTLLYFVDPPIPGPNLSGMFFWRYGDRLTVNATDSGAPAHLREHAVAYVYTFDDAFTPHEQQVDRDEPAHASPDLPVEFAEPLRLDGFEMTSAQVHTNETRLLLLYWKATRRVDRDWTVFVHLVDSQGNMVAGYDHAPRRGAAPTSTWVPGEGVADAVRMALPPQVQVGVYHLEVGLYDAATMERVRIPGRNGEASTDQITIEPIKVLP